MKETIEAFIKYQFLLKQLVLRDIKVKYKRSVLGILWSILNPLLMMSVLNIIFSELFKIQIDNFLVYYLTGFIVFSFFAEATGTSLSSIYGNSALIMKVYIPKYIFPLSKTISVFVNILFALLAVAIMVVVTGVKLKMVMLLIPLLLFYLFIFTMGVALFFSTYAVFFRDLQHLHGIMMSLLMYLTPIMYPIEIIPERYEWILNFNPLYYYVKYFRELVLGGTVPSIELNLICISFSIFSLLLGLYVFKKNQYKFILYM
ncbi:ABC-2 type transport system permease protein [Bacillus fengqiuensis]|nr:ABC-2 type transport system permease protein [Bacillus fengqiuensis]